MNYYINRKFTGVCIALLFFVLETFAQDAVFSQFFNSTLYLNPAMAGIEDDFIFTTSYRKQWASIANYNTTQVSMIMPIYTDQHLKPLGHIGGVGLSIYNDVAGQEQSFKTVGANGNFAYNLPLDPNHVNVVHFGLQTGFIQKRVNTQDLIWGSQYDPYYGGWWFTNSGEQLDLSNKAYLDIGSGVFWWYNPLPKENQKIISINSGLSVAHMNHPNESMIIGTINRLPLLYKYHGGIVFSLSHHLTASIDALVAYQGKTYQQNYGSYFTYRFFAHGSDLFAENFVRLGGWYRFGDAAIILSEFETTKFKIGFSYDWNNSSLRYTNLGVYTYEVFFSLKFTQHAPPKSRY